MSTAILRFRQPDSPPDQRLRDEEFLLALIESLPDPIAVFEGDSLLIANSRFTAVGRSENQTSELLWRDIPFSACGRCLTLRVLDLKGASTENQHLSLMGQLVGGVAHDFNNLLTGILLYCDVLQNMAPSSPIRSRVDEIRHAAEQGACLIRQLMSVGREDPGASARVSLNHVVLELLPLFRHLLGEHIRVITDLSDDAGPVGISLAQSQQIILNLTLNARDAMPDGGELRIETRPRPYEGTGRGDRIVELTVTDTGAGMDAQTAGRIFEPFFTTKCRGRGTGLGLATVRKIVEHAGGIVCVETAPGRGTRMTVRLPGVPDSADSGFLQTPSWSASHQESRGQKP